MYGHPQVESVAAGDLYVACVQGRDQCATATGVLVSRVVDVGDGVGVVEQAQQHALQEPATPSLAQLPAVDDLAEQLTGSAHGGQAKVGAMGFGEAADVDYLVRDPLT